MPDTFPLSRVSDCSVVWYDRQLWVVVQRPGDSLQVDLRGATKWIEVPTNTEVVVVKDGFDLATDYVEALGSKPVHTHDCKSCTYLGTVPPGSYSDTPCDLYVCPQGHLPTVIARYGSEGPQYTSGILFAKDHLKANRTGHPLAIAYKRAVQYGLLTGEEIS